MLAQTEVARLDRPAADAVQMVEGQYRKVEGMPQFDPHLVRIMRDVLEDIMTRVPTEQSTQAVKAYLAECILKAAAQGIQIMMRSWLRRLIRYT